MNRQETNKRTTVSQNGGVLPTNRPPHAAKNRPDPTLLALMRGIMLILCGLIVLTGLLLLVLPMFRVKNIEVVGNSYYTADEIIALSMIKVGDEILTLDLDSASGQIYDACSYVSTVKVVRYPFKVKIIVKERENVIVTEHNGKFYTLSDRFLVLEESDNAETFSAFPKVILPEIAHLAVGETVEFENGETDLTYLFDLMQSLKQSGRFDDVVSIDCARKFGVSYVRGDRFRVELGAVSDMETKLELVDLILERKAGDDATFAVVNVSDLKKPTFRAVGTPELLLG